MNRAILALGILAGAGRGWSAEPARPASVKAAPPATAVPVERNRPAPPERNNDLPAVIDPGAIDRNADPCVDFYQYACGTWAKNTPVPGDETRWFRSSELDERTRGTLRSILEEAAADAGLGKEPRPNKRKLGDFYASCMAEDRIEAKGLSPLQPELRLIDGMSGVASLGRIAAALESSGVGTLFSFASAQDYTDASTMIALADQGGFTLPDRDYYLTKEFAADREAYRAHVGRMLKFLGGDEKSARAQADAVLRVESALAKAAMGRLRRREPSAVHNKTALAKFVSWTPSFDWKAYLAGIGAPAFDSLDVGDPSFFKSFEKILKTTPLADWKSYLRWHVLHASAALGPKAVVDEDFAFFDARLDGQKEQKARWKRCVEHVDGGALGEALGQAYVERAFPPASKARVLEMVRGIEAAMAKDLRRLPWMSAATRARALEKLAAIGNKIGYPDKWRDYSALEVVRGDSLGSEKRAAAFEMRRQLSKIGGPVDRGEWGMTPPTNNASYSPQMNDVNFPAGGLQRPNFDPDADDAANYGAVGAIIGHELTHAFDDEGRHYDARGNLTDWWTAKDAKEFEARSKGFVDQYASFVAAKDPSGDASKDLKLDGRLTLGENTADNGGLLIAYAAFEAKKDALNGPLVDGLDPRQRFFVAFGQSWCLNMTDAFARQAVTVDEHAPGNLRVNGTVSNMPEFARAFGCKTGAPMAPAKIHRVW